MWIVKWLLDIGTLRPKEVRDTAILNAYAIRHLRYSSLYRPRHRERLPWRQPIWLIRFKITYSKASRWIWKTARRVRRLFLWGRLCSPWSFGRSGLGRPRVLDMSAWRAFMLMRRVRQLEVAIMWGFFMKPNIPASAFDTLTAVHEHDAQGHQHDNESNEFHSLVPLLFYQLHNSIKYVKSQ